MERSDADRIGSSAGESADPVIARMRESGTGVWHVYPRMRG